jgi:hypothetical protein
MYARRSESFAFSFAVADYYYCLFSRFAWRVCCNLTTKKGVVALYLLVREHQLATM